MLVEKDAHVGEQLFTPVGCEDLVQAVYEQEGATSSAFCR